MWEHLIAGEARDGFGFILDGNVNDLGMGNRGFQQLDSPFDETLLFPGCMVFGIFFQVAMRPRFGNRCNNLRPVNFLQGGEFFTQTVCAGPG
jgi:hypothetical protein